MFGKLVRKLFGAKSSVEATTGGVRPDESLEALHAEFCREFCHRPHVNFMDFLQREGVHRMVDWLRWETVDPLAQSFTLCDLGAPISNRVLAVLRYL